MGQGYTANMFEKASLISEYRTPSSESSLMTQSSKLLYQLLRRENKTGKVLNANIQGRFIHVCT
jgi:hypothetical protein